MASNKLHKNVKFVNMGICVSDFFIPERLLVGYHHLQCIVTYKRAGILKAETWIDFNAAFRVPHAIK